MGHAFRTEMLSFQVPKGILAAEALNNTFDADELSQLGVDENDREQEEKLTLLEMRKRLALRALQESVWEKVEAELAEQQEQQEITMLQAVAQQNITDLLPNDIDATWFEK